MKIGMVSPYDWSYPGGVRDYVRHVLRDERFDVIHVHEPLIPALPLTVLHCSRTLNVGTFHACDGSRIASTPSASPILRHSFHRLAGRIAVSRVSSEKRGKIIN